MRNVVVTGGTRGLGLAITRRLAAAGYNVIVVARQTNQQFVSATQDVEHGSQTSVHLRLCDLAESAGIPDFVRGIHREFGSIYGLVNNAGVGTSGVLATMRDRQIEHMVQVNTLSLLILTKYVVRSMMTGAGGRIVNVGSIVGLTGYSGLSVYGATKAAILGFTRCLARELGPLDINVNAVAPGFVDTEMTRSLSEQQRQQIIRRSALRRVADVDDIADAVEFLLGHRARNVTGTVLTVDAGSTA